MVHGRKAKKEVRAKVEIARCLKCECAAKRGRRGLCQSHYDFFYDEWTRQRTAAARKKFDSDEVAAGNILAARPGKRTDKQNPYTKTA